MKINKKDRNEIELKSRFLREFEELILLTPQYKIAQVMMTILYRNAGNKDPYFYSNEETLKRTELMRRDIEEDYINDDEE